MSFPKLWTAGDEAALAKHVGAGLSAGQIGEILNRTRNSIIGKCRRAKLQLKGPPMKLHKPREPSLRSPAAPFLFTSGEPPVWVKDDSAASVIFLDRKASECAWPLSDDDTINAPVCGAGVVKGCYCARHARKAWPKWKAAA